jgi:GPH family glycoside/pentoside/hexuronide:cation symporter
MADASSVAEAHPVAPEAMHPEPDQTPERIPLSLIAAYGMPSFAGAAMAIPIAVHLSIFYSDTILVPLGFIAVVKAVARAFDAITDPIMGWVTDRTRTRWGRRRPWIAIGAPLASICFVLMFWPPAALSMPQAAAWFTVTYVAYYLFHTVYAIPHAALGPELTLEYKDRIRLYGWERVFTVPGTLVAAILPGVLLGAMSARNAYLTFAAIFAVLLTLLYMRLVYRVHERPDFVDRAPNPLVPGVRRVMRNRVFRILLAVFLTGALTGAIPGTLMPFYTKYVLQPDNPNRWISIYLAIYFGSGFLCLPIWIWAARRFGKTRTWLAHFVPGTTGTFMFFFLGPGDLMLAAVALAWAGTSFAAAMVISPSMQADVIDYDELYTGKRREAQFVSLWSVLTKFMVIPSMSIPLAILASYGYQPNVEQSDSVQFVIKAIFALGPSTTGVIGFCISLLYPLSEKAHRQIWQGIEAHKRGEPAIDPITGRRIAPPNDRGVDEDTGWFLDHFSPRELRRYLEGGPASLIRSTSVALAISIGVCGLGTWIGVREASDLSVQPGLLAVLAIVAAGFGLTAFCFHTMRLRAARLMTRRPIPAELVRAHVDVVDHMLRGDPA